MYDLKGARAAGISDTDISTYLATLAPSYDLPAARAAKVNDAAIADYLLPLVNKYETTLPAGQEPEFQKWKAANAPKDSGADYDLRGAFEAGVKPDPETGHWPDTFKKPNHPTFSNQSKYAEYGKPGTWDGETYTPAGGAKPPAEPEGILSAIGSGAMTGLRGAARVVAPVYNELFGVSQEDLETLARADPSFKPESVGVRYGPGTILEQFGKGKPSAGIADAKYVGQQLVDAAIYHTPAAFASALEGRGAKEGEPDWKDALIERASALSEKRNANPNIPDAVKNLGPSMGFSLVSMLGGVGAGVGTTAVTRNPAAGWTAGVTASGALAYRMSTNQFTRQLYDAANADSVERTGKPISAAEWELKQDKLAPLITEYGMFEAAPEAASQGFGLKIISAPLKAGIRSIFGKSILTRFATKTASVYGVELGTETFTQQGQRNVEVEATGEGTPRSWTSAADLGESFNEVAPSVILQTAIMGGGAKTVLMLRDRVTRGGLTPKQFDAIQELNNMVDSAQIDPEGARQAAVRMLDPNSYDPNLISPRDKASAAPPVAPAEPTAAQQAEAEIEETLARTRANVLNGAEGIEPLVERITDQNETVDDTIAAANLAAGTVPNPVTVPDFVAQGYEIVPDVSDNYTRLTKTNDDNTVNTVDIGPNGDVENDTTILGDFTVNDAPVSVRFDNRRNILQGIEEDGSVTDLSDKANRRYTGGEDLLDILRAEDANAAVEPVVRTETVAPAPDDFLAQFEADMARRNAEAPVFLPNQPAVAEATAPAATEVAAPAITEIDIGYSQASRPRDVNWLPDKQDAAEEAVQKQGNIGVSGPITADTDIVYVDPAKLAEIPGAMDEQPGPGNPKYDALLESMGEEGFNEENVLLVGINHRGEPYIIEGNNRAAVARDLGIKSVPVEFRWYAGGEDAGGFGPADVAALVPNTEAAAPAATEAAAPALPQNILDLAEKYFVANQNLTDNTNYTPEGLGRTPAKYKTAATMSFRRLDTALKEIEPDQQKRLDIVQDLSAKNEAKVSAPATVEASPAVTAWAEDTFGDQTAPDGSLVKQNFANWFGDGKITDGVGNPLPVYHATAANIDEFDLDNPNRKDAGWLGNGVYLTDSTFIANTIAGDRDGANVMPLYARLKNPYPATLKEKNRIQRIQLSKGKAAAQKASREFTEKLQSQGYDGVVLEAMGAKEIVVFDTAGVKSATGNNGQFGSNNRDIRYSIKSDKMGAYLPPGDTQREANLAKFMEGSYAPYVLYTGTSKDVDFKTFNIPKNGVWFTTNAKDASDYAEDNDSQGFRRGDGWSLVPTNTASRVIPVHLSAKNPKVYENPKELNDRIYSLAKENYKRGQGLLFDELRQAGYDSVHIGQDTWVALSNPAQIKSAIGNDGQFDPNNRNINLSVKSGTETNGQTVTAVQDQLIPLKGITVEVVQSTSDLPEAAAPSMTEGAWYSGTTVYLVADNLPNARRVQEVLAHEAIGHAALETMLGQQLMTRLVKNVQVLERAGDRQIRVVGAYVDQTQPGLASDDRAKEILAVMAERGLYNNSIWARAVQAVRLWLRGLGFTIAFTDKDIQGLLSEAAKFANRAPETQAIGGRYSLGEGEATVTRSKPSINKKRIIKLFGPQLYGDMKDIPSVTVKELFQNSFDAVKGALERGDVSLGRISITADENTRSITIVDNGGGMGLDTINKAFLTMAGTEKDTKRASGGLGIAKMLFLVGNKTLTLETVRAGQVHRMNTSGPQIEEALDDPEFAPSIETRSTTAAPGTTVVVTIPETYEDNDTGVVTPIRFPYDFELRDLIDSSPLLANVEVKFNGDVRPIGANYDLNGATVLTEVKFAWGTARLLIRPNAKAPKANLNVLSEGLNQFTLRVSKDPSDPYSGAVPYDFILNLEPTVKADSPRYPIALNRKGFSVSAESDMNALIQYVNVLYANKEDQDSAKTFGVLELHTPVLFGSGQIKNIDLQIPDAAVGTVLSINPTDVVQVIDGRVVVNNRPLPPLTKDNIKAMRRDPKQFRVDQSKIDKNAIIVHDNVLTDGKPLLEEARAALGVDAVNSYLTGLGRVLQDLRAATANVGGPKYAGVTEVPVGFSFDTGYYGVNTSIPFKAIMLNPMIVRDPLTGYPMRTNAASKAERAGTFVGTMVHELTHHAEKNHSETGFIPELARLSVQLAVSGDLAAAVQRVDQLLQRYDAVAEYFMERNENGNITARGVRLAGAAERTSPRVSERATGSGRTGRDGKNAVREGVTRGNTTGAGSQGRGGLVAEGGRGAALNAANVEALTVNSVLSESYPTAKPRSRDVTAIATELMRRGSAALKKLGVASGVIEGPSPRTDDILASAIASEVKTALGRTGKNASGWYSKRVKEAMKIALKLHPELADKNQRMAFTLALAITSQGETVASNVRLAEQVYSSFKKTGVFPTDVSALKQKSMNGNFERINDLIADLGLDETNKFLSSEFTVKQLEDAGYSVGGENKQTKVYGSAILGPKIGQGFYQNLNNNFEPVTMDLWFMRGWGRLTGNLVGGSQAALDKQRERFEAALKTARRPVPRTLTTLISLARGIVAKHESDYRDNRAKYDSGKRVKSELTYAAERIVFGQDGLKETPSSGSEREWIRSVIAQARAKLKADGINITPADLQAVWWYPEKELYSKLGGRDSEGINVDYATEIRNLYDRRRAEGQLGSVVDRPGPGSAGNVEGPVQSSGERRKGSDGTKAKVVTSIPYNSVQTTTRLNKLEEETDPVALKDGVAALARDLRRQADAKPVRERARGYDWIQERLLRAARLGEMNREQVRLGMWLLNSNPNLANDLGISLRATKSDAASGNYNPMSRIMSLFKGRGQDTLIAHEILHHSERMMPREVQDGIRAEWLSQIEGMLAAAIRTGNDEMVEHLRDTLRAATGNTSAYNRVADAIRNGTLSEDFYQYINPSEFWAVNAGDIVAGRANESWVGRAVQWLKEFSQKIKEVFGLPSTAAVIRGLDNVINAANEGERQSPDMLAEGDTFNAMGNRTEPTLPVPEGKLEVRKDWVTYNYIDRFVDLKNLMNTVRSLVNVLPENLDAYGMVERLTGRVAERIRAFGLRDISPLLADMKMRGVNLGELDEYLWKRSAERANELIAAQEDSKFPDGGGAGISTEDAQAYLAALTPEKRTALEALAKRVDAITAETRRVWVRYGMATLDDVLKMEKEQPNYVPLNREGKGRGMGTGQGVSVRGPNSYHRVGSSLPVVDVLAQIIDQRNRAITRGEKNLIGRAIYALAKKFPDPDLWKLAAPGLTSAVDVNTGEPVTVLDMTYQGADNVLMSFRIDKNGKLTAQGVEFNTDNEQAVRMATALKNLDLPSLGMVFNSAAQFTRYFAKINTQYNLVFGLVNFARDVPSAGLNLTTTPIAGKQLELALHIPAAIRAIYKLSRAESSGQEAASSEYGDFFKRFRQAGGATGWYGSFDTSADRGVALQKELNALSKGTAGKLLPALGAWVTDYNSAMENSTRLAAFITAVNAGMSDAEAASLAKNLTVNFDRKGAYTSQMSSLYAFFNPAVQGTVRTLETLKGPAGKKIIAAGLLLGALEAVALAAAGFDDDDPPEFVRQRNIIIPIGNKKYVMFPMPLGFNVIPTIGRLAMQTVLNPKKIVANAVTAAGAVLSTFNPLGAGLTYQTFAPTLIDPIVAIGTNTDWTGRPIERKDFSALDPTPGYTRAKDSASAVSTFIARVINAATLGDKSTPGGWSPTPDLLDFVAGQATGGAGRELMNLETSIESWVAGKETPPYKIPILGRLYGTTGSAASQTAKYYQNTLTINKLENKILDMRRDRVPSNDFRRDNPLTRVIPAANMLKRQITNIRNQKKERVLDDKTADERILKVMQRLNTLVEKRS